MNVRRFRFVNGYEHTLGGRGDPIAAAKLLEDYGGTVWIRYHEDGERPYEVVIYPVSQFDWIIVDGAEWR